MRILDLVAGYVVTGGSYSEVAQVLYKHAGRLDDYTVDYALFNDQKVPIVLTTIDQDGDVKQILEAENFTCIPIFGE